jgi:hypothetical protein
VAHSTPKADCRGRKAMPPSCIETKQRKKEVAH